MARLPSFEHILIEIHQSLGLERPPSKQIAKFTQAGFLLPRHQQFKKQLMDEIFSALEMDERARTDAQGNIDEWTNFDQGVARHTWTHEASEQQVLWHLLAYSYIPGLARRLAFWSLAGAERGIPFDAGMPGGEFWFLPTWNQSNGTVQLPVQGVLEWLLDLLGDQSLEHAANALQSEQAQRKNMNALRTLQGWRLEGTLPQSAKVIDEMFHDHADFDFRGCLRLSADSSADDQFSAAVAFVQRRGLAPEALEHEVPFRAARLRTILDGGSSAQDEQAFTLAIAVRYAAPSMLMIRQRLRIARMAQDGYQRLLKMLCGPTVGPRCADPTQNKLLALLALFHTVYNLTIQSYREGSSQVEQDSWFESRFAPWDQCDLMVAIMPSARGIGHQLLGERLTRRFIALGSDSPLPDLVPLAASEHTHSTVLARIQMLKDEAAEDGRIAALISAASAASPCELTRLLKSENSYLVASQLCQSDALSEQSCALALRTVRELASTPAEHAGAAIIELALLLDRAIPIQATGAQSTIARLLQDLEANAGHAVWKAPFLRFRARHKLMLNDFEGASQDFRSALQACFERNHGTLQAEIAREGLATEVAMRGLDKKSQDLYYRHLVHSDARPSSFENTAVSCETFFWEELYRPYVNVDARSSQPTAEIKKLVTRSIELIHQADSTELRSWLLKHENKLRPLKVKDVRGDSLLLMWMKHLDGVEQLTRIPARMGALRPGRQLPGDAVRKAIGVLANIWPEQAKTSDFKGQTPLMLAADRGDIGLATLLTDLSDIDNQDYLGRTALHSAVTGGSSKCIELLLDRGPDVAKVTFDEQQTALHTAVRFGDLKAVLLIGDGFPCCLARKNVAGLTPLDLAKEVLDNYDEWHIVMRQNNRRMGSKEEVSKIILQLQKPQHCV